MKTFQSVLMIIVAILAPWYPIGVAAYKLSRSGGKKYTHLMLILASPFYLWLLRMALEPLVASISYVGWTIVFGFCTYGTGVRYALREKFAINWYIHIYASYIVYLKAGRQDKSPDVNLH